MYAGGANFMFLFFMNVYHTHTHTYPYCLIYFLPFVDDLAKKGKGIWFIYACLLTKRGRNIWWFIYACLLHVYFILKKGEKDFLYFIQKGGEGFWREGFLIYACLSPSLCIYICLVLCTSLNIYLFIVMHELWGSLYEA